MNNSNGNIDLLFQRERRARARGTCWACHRPGDARRCDRCWAPRWSGPLINASNFTADVDTFGAYVLDSDVGMVKVGVSATGCQQRAGWLVDQAAGRGITCWTVALLPGAGRLVERWLLDALPGRDSHAAQAVGLPQPTEWLHGSEAVDRIVAGQPWWPGR